MDDALNLAWAGILDYPTALKVTKYLTEETNYIPWKSAITGFNYLLDMMKGTSGFAELKHYLLASLQPLYDRLGFQEIPGETFLDKQLRILMWQVMCRLDQVECQENSRVLMDQWMSVLDPDTENPIPTSVRGTVLCSAIGNGNETSWDFLWSRYNNSNNDNEKVSIMQALACSKEVRILERYLKMTLTEDSGLRKEDGEPLIVGVSRSLAVPRHNAWSWIRDNWDRLSSYNYDMDKIINGVAEDLNTPLELAELERFIVDHEDKLGSAGEDQTLQYCSTDCSTDWWITFFFLSGREAKLMVESTKANINWMNQHYQTVVDWLKQNR